MRIRNLRCTSPDSSKYLGCNAAPRPSPVPLLPAICRGIDTRGVSFPAINFETRTRARLSRDFTRRDEARGAIDTALSARDSSSPPPAPLPTSPPPRPSRLPAAMTASDGTETP